MSAIQGALPPQINLPIAVPLGRDEIVKKIAVSCLKEFALTLTLSVTVACFVPTPVGIAYIITATFVQLAVSIFFHSLGAYAQYSIGQKGPNVAQFEKILNVCQWVTGANFALLTGFNTQMLIHETGHSLAALFSYKRPQPKIELYPFMGGITQFYKTSLSGFGKKIGPVATTCFVIASGPAFTLLISSALLAIGLAMKEKYPQFGKYLIAWGLLDFLNHANYAYSALRTDQSSFSHDFAHLAIFGLHPVVATISIVAIPIVIYLGVQWLQPNPRPAVV
jgi:hypothetical protein